MKTMKTIFLFLALIGFFSAQSQATYRNNLTNALGLTLLTDTVTNTGTAFVQADASRARGNVMSIIWNAVKISGIVAGTISLHGSNDNTNYASISSTTFTATDVASQSGSWLLTGSPCRFYRITWTGAGAMAATIKASMWVNSQD